MDQTAAHPETVLVAFHPKAPELRITIHEYRTWDREVLMDNLVRRHGFDNTNIEIVTEAEAARLVTAGARRVL